MSGSGGGCASSSGPNGSTDQLASTSCDAAASAGNWHARPLETRVALGGSPTAPCLPWLCQIASSSRSACLPSQPVAPHNPPNRRIRDPYVRWCGRGGVARLPPIPMCAEYERQLGGGSPLSSLMAAKD